jgi:hypothetical protein
MRVALIGAWVALACSGGGGPGGPDEPGNGLQVSGTWMETVQVVSNPCGLELPGQSSGTLQLVQNGTQLTAISEGLSISGTINTTNGDFTLSGVFSVSGLEITIVQSGNFSSSSRYTAETMFTITDGSATCTVQTSDSGIRQ